MPDSSNFPLHRMAQNVNQIVPLVRIENRSVRLEFVIEYVSIEATEYYQVILNVLRMK